MTAMILLVAYFI